MALQATVALGSLLPKLAELLHGEYGLHKGTRKDIEFLSRELQSMHDALQIVAEVPLDRLNQVLRLWAHDAREMSYDMEDVIDTILVPADGRQPRRLRWKTANLCGLKKNGIRRQIAAGTGLQIADVFQKFKDLVKELAERRDRYKIDAIVPFGNLTTSTVDPRLPALYRNERELVGIEEARDGLVNMLMAEGDELKIVSIVGQGGVGKTTLARAVYNRLHAEFSCSAFVPVSQKPNMKKVFEGILLELDEERYMDVIDKTMDERQLIDEIRRFLKNKRYLIVIDDIWDTSTWDLIRCALPDDNHGNRIIITTRIFTTAAHTGVPYELKPLSYVNSEKLFYKRVFGGEGNRPDNQLPEVPQKVLEKCGGLPLAIITVANILASKPWEDWSWEDWSRVESYIRFGHEGNRYLENMRQVLSFSYYDLPSYLKACLLHLSVFPEEYLIEKDVLIWRWIAEGFVQWQKMDEGLFELGEKYFNELVNRNMIQIVQDSFRGAVDGCRIYGILHSLIYCISREKTFVTILDDEQHTSPRSNGRRLVLNKRNVEHHIIEANMSMAKLRSFDASLCFINGMPQVSSFHVLRVLALEYCMGMEIDHLSQIGNLVHLRYLGLLGISVLNLPEEAVRGPRFLQTLDLRETGIEELPQAIVTLPYLMCLWAGRTRTAVPEGMGNLTCLEDLRLHCVSNNSVKLAAELGRLQRLRVLDIGFEEMDDKLAKDLAESLKQLQKIQRLEVYCESSRKAVRLDHLSMLPQHLRQLVVGGIWFSRMPRWANPVELPILSHLHLGVEVVEAEDLEILGRLPELSSLMLVTACGEQGSSINTVNESSFPRLRFFMTSMPVIFQQGSMPRLEDLEFWVNVQAAMEAGHWLSSLANLTSLRKVTVALQCHGASAAEVEEAEAAMRREVGILRQSRPIIEVNIENEAHEVSLVEKLRPKNSRFEAMQRQMAEMQASHNRQPDDDSNEIRPAETGSPY